ncbi:MAG: hypothetical protein ACKVOR_03410 [Flavobacteriales bacterium]
MVSEQKANSNVIDVKIYLTQTSSYCGGAEPPDELLIELATPQPLSGKKLHIKKGSNNDPRITPIASLNSLADGLAEMQLEPGSYCVVYDNKVDSAYFKMLLSKHSVATQSYSEINKKCIERWLLTAEYSFIVHKDSSNVHTFNHHNQCAWGGLPCMNYNGPYPP